MTSATCRLCLSSASVLTQEHIPPQSVGNTGPHDLRALSLDNGKLTEVHLPNGFALTVLCARCNTRYGSRLGTTFAGFVQQVQQSGRFISPRGGVYALALDVYPARVFRQLLLNYLCLHPPTDEGNLPFVRNVVRSRAPIDVDNSELPRIGLYCNVSTTYRVVPVGSLGTLGHRKEPWLGAEIAAPGLGVVFTLGNRRDVHPALNPKLADITHWASDAFTAIRRILLELPRYRVETPHPLGFGTPREVDKWQTRNNVIWLATRFDTDVGENMGAIMWKPATRQRRPRRPSV